MPASRSPAHASVGAPSHGGAPFFLIPETPALPSSPNAPLELTRIPRAHSRPRARSRIPTELGLTKANSHSRRAFRGNDPERRRHTHTPSPPRRTAGYNDRSRGNPCSRDTLPPPYRGSSCTPSYPHPDAPVHRRTPQRTCILPPRKTALDSHTGPRPPPPDRKCAPENTLCPRCRRECGIHEYPHPALPRHKPGPPRTRSRPSRTRRANIREAASSAQGHKLRLLDKHIRL
jgi:hypothetical protein